MFPGFVDCFLHDGSPDIGNRPYLITLWDVYAISMLDAAFFRPTLEVLLAMPFRRLHRVPGSLYLRKYGVGFLRS